MINNAMAKIMITVDMSAFFFMNAVMKRAIDSKDAPIILATKSVSAILSSLFSHSKQNST